MFSLTTGGLERFPYRFQGGTNGTEPEAGLLNVAGTRYGTTAYGGIGDCRNLRIYGCGTIFSVTANGTFRQLYAFPDGSSSPDGANPKAALIDVNGTLYGTTEHGGGGFGTVFSITPDGQENVLHRFGGIPDGRHPVVGLLDVNGTLYGTTPDGGAIGSTFACGLGCGTVFSITTNGQERVLYSFQGVSDGSGPSSALINVNGTLYGTTSIGGNSPNCGIWHVNTGCGTVFSITRSGHENVLYRFQGGSDGAYPSGALLNVKGTLYGTTRQGGLGYGTVFSVTTSGQERVLYSFNPPPDGTTPLGGLVNVNGTLYGTTGSGGTGCPYSGCGAVFSITTSGQETVLHSFQ